MESDESPGNLLFPTVLPALPNLAPKGGLCTQSAPRGQGSSLSLILVNWGEEGTHLRDDSPGGGGRKGFHDPERLLSD